MQRLHASAKNLCLEGQTSASRFVTYRDLGALAAALDGKVRMDDARSWARAGYPIRIAASCIAKMDASSSVDEHYSLGQSEGCGDRTRAQG